MHFLAEGFWWLNVLASGWSILYWAPKRFKNGWPALLMPSGQVWIWQLAASILIRIAGTSPWNLIWIAVLSVIVSALCAKAIDRLGIFDGQDPKHEKTGLPISAIYSQETLEAVSFLPLEEQREALAAYLQLFPDQIEGINRYEAEFRAGGRNASAWELASILGRCAEHFADVGDYVVASSIMHHSLSRFPENPRAWAMMAEIYCGWRDRIGARWADRVISYRPLKTSPEEVRQMWTAETSSLERKEIRHRMREIIATCSAHPEWRDSYPLKKETGSVDF